MEMLIIYKERKQCRNCKSENLIIKRYPSDGTPGLKYCSDCYETQNYDDCVLPDNLTNKEQQHGRA